MVRLAKCCTPLPGDEIVGYVTKGRGVAVHRVDCPNANQDSNEFFTKRLVEVSWDDEKSGTFETEIYMKIIDRRGIINDITHIISNEKISLNGINARKNKDGNLTINLLVEVENINILNLLIKKLRAIPGVNEIYRLNN